MIRLSKYLESTKNRLIFMSPQTIVWIITVINFLLTDIFGINHMPYLVYIHITSAILMSISAYIILFTDYKKSKAL